MQRITGVTAPHKLATDQRTLLTRLVGSRLQNLLNFVKKQTPGRKDSEKNQYI